MENKAPYAFDCQPVLLKSANSQEISLQVARLDRIHPVISGNKIFKLHFFLEKAALTSHKTVITFGGAYSNHLVATAYACKQRGLKCIGIVRGNAAELTSFTAEQCLEYGMQLVPVSREDYRKKEYPEFLTTLRKTFGEFLLISEGGYHPFGMLGASLIMQHEQLQHATHICTAVGTATTLAGLVKGGKPTQKFIAVPVLKNMLDIPGRLSFLLGTKEYKIPAILDNYHFGGYAKYDSQLISFMNTCYADHQLPTDFVYTAKLMFAVLDMIKEYYFPSGSKVVCLHTGGLQGNLSLPHGTLNFA